ncbi:MAG: DNA topoisomerase [Capnocytophaga sp.]|nr:DNA topoisomerase [Capnocytophaga sp.]
MKKILIIAEKPTQGKMYAQALSNFDTHDGYLENDRYIITWAFGHLIELAKDTAYRTEGKWDKSYLPLIPELLAYQYVAKDDSGVKKQLKTIGSLLDKAGEIYCATDADREGELIFRYIYHYLKCKLPFKRVWLSSLDDEEIRKAFVNPKFTQGDAFLENLSKSAYSRAIADWLIGVNGTQSATLQFGAGNLLSIGRVQTIILKIVCERYQKNKNHEKTYTFKIIAMHTHNSIEFTSESDVFEDRNEVAKVFSKLSEQHTFVNRELKKETKKAPLLHTLDSLTIVANKFHKYDASQVLAAAQKLYEAKLISYPRTEDAYITEEGYGKLKKSLQTLAKEIVGVEDFQFPDYTPQSVDGSKITGSHDALIPTGQTAELSKLSQQELDIYRLIIRRCLESFSDPAIFEKNKYLFENQNTPFVTRTSKQIQVGWMQYSPSVKGKDDEAIDENNEEYALELPYKNGDKVTIYDKKIRDIESKPPAIYNPATLTEDLSNLAKFLQNENPDLYENLKNEIDLKALQIGTKATRPEIIKQLVERRKFIAFEKNKYTPTQLGMQFYETIRNMEVVNVGETAKLEHQLLKVTQGEISENEFYHKVSDYVTKMVNGVFTTQATVQAQRKNFGQCPKCKKGAIYEGKKGFGCSAYKEGCDFVIWKEIASKNLSVKNIEDLLQKGKTALVKGLKSKAGKEFEAYIVLDENYKTTFEFKKK